MIANRVRSSVTELGPRHCPAAIAHARLGTPREPSHEMLIGKATHAVAEAAAIHRDQDQLAVIDAAAVAIVRGGIPFESDPPEFPTIEQALAGRRLALGVLDKHPLPAAEWMQAELEVNLTSNGWAVIEARECAACTGGVLGVDDIGEELCGACDGTGKRWPPHWHQLLDLAWQGEEEDAYENPVLVAGGRDYKGWDAGNGWFDRLQGAGYAVALASLFPDAQVIRRECAGYQTRSLFTDEIDVRTEEGQDRMNDYRRELELAIEAQRAQPLDVEALALPGPGCFAGYGGCPYFSRCDPAQRRSSDLNSMLDAFGKFGSIEGASEAFALGQALAQEGARQLKGYGGGPITTPSGHNVGWKDSTSPTGKVDDNAPLWLAREYAIFVLNRPDSAPLVEGTIRAAGVGRKGAGVSVVRKIVKQCIRAGMTKEDGEGLLARCLKPKYGRTLAIWRGRLPTEEERLTREKAIESDKAADVASSNAALARQNEAADRALLEKLKASVVLAKGKAGS